MNRFHLDGVNSSNPSVVIGIARIEQYALAIGRAAQGRRTRELKWCALFFSGFNAEVHHWNVELAPIPCSDNVN